MSSVGMLRRNARLRKEYLYRKSLEGKEKELYEKKRKIRQALEGTQACMKQSANAFDLDPKHANPRDIYTLSILQKENLYRLNYGEKKQS